MLDDNGNVLLLSDGSLICRNCTDRGRVCGNNTEDLAILIGDQAFCTTCFSCCNCDKRIENFKYAQTSRGISCVECYESLIKRRPKKRGVLKNRPPKLELDGIDKDLPPLPVLGPPRPVDLIPEMRPADDDSWYFGGLITPTGLSGSFKPGSQGIGSENDQNLFGFF